MSEFDTNSSLNCKRHLSRQLDLAQTGIGSDWMDAKTGLAFAEYALTMGFGISLMEGYGTGKSRGKHGIYHQILGVDDIGTNWTDHRDPARALRVVKEKFLLASEDQIDLMYKFWIEFPE